MSRYNFVYDSNQDLLSMEPAKNTSTVAFFPEVVTSGSVVARRKRKTRKLGVFERLVLFMIRVVYALVLRWKRAKRDTKEGIVAILLICLTMPVFFIAGRQYALSVNTYGFWSRFGTALLQSTMFSVCLVVGFRVVKDVVYDLKYFIGMHDE